VSINDSLLDELPDEITEYINNVNASREEETKGSKFKYFNPKHPLKYIKAPKISAKVLD
jgi:hypothetical protein